MDPFTLALATFGVQKLRGKSTKRALRDAALVGGGSQVYGMAGGPGVTPFGQAGITSLRDTTAAQLAGFKGSVPTTTGTQVPFGDLQESPFADPGDGITSYADEEIKTTFKEIPYKEAKKMARAGELNMDFVERYKDIGSVPVSQQTFITADRDYSNLRKRGIESISKEVTDESAVPKSLFDKFKDTSAGTKLALAATAAPLLMGGEEDPKPPFTEEDYKKAYEEQSAKLEGAFVPTRNARPTMDETFGSNMFYANEGGLANMVSKFNQGGINYLPSKSDHDENDYNNYVRAEGYVEDGAGNGDKDEDTMLAQLADGEFVSRADAVLGAGILSGGDPKSYKSMRKAGADFFYGQQKQLKRIYDLVNASKTDN